MFGSFAYASGQFARGPFIITFGAAPASVILVVGEYETAIMIVGNYILTT